MSDGPKSRAERQAETRDRLLMAAMEVFASKGFHRASIDAIARHAGFTKGAVYANFASKDDLFLAVVDRRIEIAFGNSDDPNLIDNVGAGELFDMAWATLSLEVILYSLRESPALHRELSQRYLQIDQAAAAALQETHDLAADEASRAALLRSALHEGLMIRRLADPDRLSADDAEQIHRTFFNAALAGGAGQVERNDQAGVTGGDADHGNTIH